MLFKDPPPNKKRDRRGWATKWANIVETKVLKDPTLVTKKTEIASPLAKVKNSIRNPVVCKTVIQLLPRRD